MINLHATAPRSKVRKLIMDTVMDVSDRYGVSISDILGKSREQDYVEPRQEVYLVLWASGLSLKRIGQALSRHHTTILHGARAAALRLANEKETRL